ncbi:MAG: hypothetical protein MJ181_04565 [Treponema sp.]|nr:hypothetical protein [Treponema sp.]
MKKIALVLVGTAMLLSFVSCGSKADPEAENKPTAPEVVEEPVVQEEETPAPVEIDTSADKAAREAAMKSYESALAAKEKIDDWELAQYDQKHYDEGNKLLAELEALLKDESISGEELQEKAKAVHAQYNSVLLLGFKKVAKEARESAYESKKMADSVKAGVAEKTRYQKAVADFKEGDTLYAMQASEKAIDRYISADDEFYDLYNELTDKRAAAQAAIEAAKKAVAEVEVLAGEADITDPVADGTEGIEAEDAVLLEEESFANPDDAVEEVPETMTEAVVENVTDFANKASNILGGEK